MARRIGMALDAAHPMPPHSRTWHSCCTFRSVALVQHSLRASSSLLLNAAQSSQIKALTLVRSDAQSSRGSMRASPMASLTNADNRVSGVAFCNLAMQPNARQLPPPVDCACACERRMWMLPVLVWSPSISCPRTCHLAQLCIPRFTHERPQASSNGPSACSTRAFKKGAPRTSTTATLHSDVVSSWASLGIHVFASPPRADPTLVVQAIHWPRVHPASNRSELVLYLAGVKPQTQGCKSLRIVKVIVAVLYELWAQRSLASAFVSSVSRRRNTATGKPFYSLCRECGSDRRARLITDVLVNHMRRSFLMTRVMDNLLTDSVGHRVTLLTTKRCLYAVLRAAR